MITTTTYSTKTVLTTWTQYNDYNISKKSNHNFNDEQTRHETNDDDNTSTNPYDDDFKSVAPPNEPVPQVITEGISETSDIIFIFKNCLLDSGGTKSLIPLSRLPKSLTKHQSTQPYLALSSLGVHQHHEYITLSKIRFPQFSTNIWLENVELIISTPANIAPTTSSLYVTSYNNSDSSLISRQTKLRASTSLYPSFIVTRSHLRNQLQSRISSMILLLLQLQPTSHTTKTSS